MNKNKICRNKKIILSCGYEYGLVEGRGDVLSPSYIKIENPCFMGMHNWALQWCRKINKRKIKTEKS